MHRILTVSVCFLALTVGLYAQDAGTPATPPATAKAPMAKAAPVLKQVPAGALGYVFVNNLKDTGAAVDKFLADIGLAPMVAATMPTGLLDFVKAQAKLGEGFNPNGGLAVVMMDPGKFGFDIFKAMNLPEADSTPPKELNLGPAPAPVDVTTPPQAPPIQAEEGSGEKTADMPAPTAKADDAKADGEAAEQKVPVVFYVAGSSVKDLVPAGTETKEEGKLTKLTLGGDEVFAVAKDGYVLFSPNQKALEAALAAEKKADSELSAAEADAFARADIGVHANMKLAAPILTKLMEKFQAMAQSGMVHSPMGMMTEQLNTYKEFFDSADSLALTGKFADTGLVFEVLLALRPDSTMGKTLAAYKPTTGPLLNKLPDLQYVLAIGCQGTGKADEASLKSIDSLFKMEPFSRVPAENQTQFKDVVKGMSEQVTGVQFVGGGAPESKGLFAMAAVLECKDTAAVKALLEKLATAAQSTVQTLGKDDEGLAALKVVYEKEAETAGDAKVDSITVTCPHFDTMSDDAKAKMATVLGENKVRLLVATPDSKTVVITFGGTPAFMAEVLKAAKEGGKIEESAEVKEALKHMPKERVALILFNGADLFNLIVAGAKAMDPNGPPPPFQIATKTPITIGVGISGTTEHVVFYIPSGLVKDGVGIWMSIMSHFGPGGGPGGHRPPGGGEDF
jgi:hypothetical protein